MQGQRVSPSASHAVTANVRLTYIVKIARVDGDDPELPGQAYGADRRRRIRGGVRSLRLGPWLQTSPQFWLNLHSAHDLRGASETIGRTVAGLPTRLGKRQVRA